MGNARGSGGRMGNARGRVHRMGNASEIVREGVRQFGQCLGRKGRDKARGHCEGGGNVRVALGARKTVVGRGRGTVGTSERPLAARARRLGAVSASASALGGELRLEGVWSAGREGVGET